MFLPGYAQIAKLLEGDTVAKKAGVQPGDIIVAVNGSGFRRFAPDYKLDEVDKISNSDKEIELDNKTADSGEAYHAMLAKIKSIKLAAADGGHDPLVLSLERYGWDAQPNAWGRFLEARDNNVPEAMQMMQVHEQWKSTTFPIALQSPGLQKILRAKAVSEIDVEGESLHDFPPTVYVHYSKLLELQTADSTITTDDVVQAFVIFTERMLAKSKDPRTPKTCQFIDLTGVSISTGFRVEMLRKIYNVFEPNYPETLYRMVMYPVTSMMATTAKTMLSFVNEKTQKKFLITNDLDKVCTELGWNKAEVEECGGVTDFMNKHEKAGTSMIFD